MGRKRKKFTLIEMLVVISIIAILASMMIPGLQAAIDSARTTSCLNNMSQVGLALQSFADENNNMLPSQRLHKSNLPSYLTGTKSYYYWEEFLLPYLFDGASVLSGFKQVTSLGGVTYALPKGPLACPSVSYEDLNTVVSAAGSSAIRTNCSTAIAYNSELSNKNLVRMVDGSAYKRFPLILFMDSLGHKSTDKGAIGNLTWGSSGLVMYNTGWDLPTRHGGGECLNTYYVNHSASTVPYVLLPKGTMSRNDYGRWR